MKRFKHHKDLIKQVIKNIPVLTPEEQLCRNVLRLNGTRNPSIKFIREVIKTQRTDSIKKQYKELTDEN